MAMKRRPAKRRTERCNVEYGNLKISNVSQKAALDFGLRVAFVQTLVGQLIERHHPNSERELFELIHAALELYRRPCGPREAQRRLKLITGRISAA